MVLSTVEGSWVFVLLHHANLVPRFHRRPKLMAARSLRVITAFLDNAISFICDSAVATPRPSMLAESYLY